MNGIIPVYKPKNYTSFDVVSIMKRLCKNKKIGHGGTLDPMAEGVLPVFVGAATKAADFAPDDRKEYLAGFRLGVETDTQDITGNIIYETPGYVSRNLLIAAKRFVGEIEQIPPMYSAVKVNGQRLYKLARKGVTVEREPRKVTVHSLEFEKYAQNDGLMRVSCSKGTYIRTLIHDIGKEIGCGAVMTSLIRTFSSGFTSEMSYTLDFIRDHISANGSADGITTPLEVFFGAYPRAFLDAEQTRLFGNGAVLLADRIVFEKIYDGIYGVINYNGRICALAKIMRNHDLGIIQRFSSNTDEN